MHKLYLDRFNLTGCGKKAQRGTSTLLRGRVGAITARAETGSPLAKGWL